VSAPGAEFQLRWQVAAADSQVVRLAHAALLFFIGFAVRRSGAI